jgi:hypothetical protein
MAVQFTAGDTCACSNTRDGQALPEPSPSARPTPSFPALLLAALAARLAGAGRAARPRGRAGRLLGAKRRRGLLRAAGMPRHQLRHPLEQHLACARRGLAVSELRAGTAKQRLGSAASVAHSVRPGLAHGPKPERLFPASTNSHGAVKATHLGTLPSPCLPELREQAVACALQRTYPVCSE